MSAASVMGGSPGSGFRASQAASARDSEDVLLHPHFDWLLCVANVFLAGGHTIGTIDSYLGSAFPIVGANSFQ
jgi:hypothetical protein